MGGWQQWDQVERQLAGKNVYLDTAFSMSYLGERRSFRVVEAFGAEHVVFGGDGPWGDVAAELARLCAMPLANDDLEAILWRNAAGLPGMAESNEQGQEDAPG
jgi:hypothetical protein